MDKNSPKRIVTLVMFGTIIIFTFVLSGCASTGGSGLRFYFVRGVNLTIIHTCTDRAIVYQGQEVLSTMVGVAPVTVPVVPNLGGDTASITVQSLDAAGGVIFTTSQTVYVSSYNREPLWYISDSPRNFGSGGVYRSNCGR